VNVTTGTSTEITGLSATELARLIASGELSSCEVVEAHIRRIEAVNPTLNAIVVPMFDQARLEAQAADRACQQGRMLGPLHGVPITVKEFFDVRGTPTTAGLTSRSKKIASKDAPLVSRLRQAGAIVLGKSNVQQLGMGFAAENPLYGRTNNPWNVARTPGGSSGGEAAMIAAGGSPLGLGSDGGGSIRQPSHSCGICGLKPTGRRFTMRGHWLVPNWSVEWAQPGPMARRVADLELALGILNNSTDDEVPDLAAPPAFLRSSAEIAVERLRIGFYTDDGLFRTAPAIRRAVKEAAQALSERGAEVVEFVPPHIEDIWRIYFGLFYAEGAHFLKRELAGSVVHRWNRQNVVWFSRLPSSFRPPLKWLMDFCGQKWHARTLRWLRQRRLSISQYFRLIEEQDHYRRRVADALNTAHLDAIICPPSPVPAFVHDCKYAPITGSYTVLYNVLGMPAGVVAATRVRPGEESDRPSSRDTVEREVARNERGSLGLPVGVQVAARPWREDIVLAVMAALEAHFQQQPDYPARPPI
jgi:fatty acid amide hydrolase